MNNTFRLSSRPNLQLEYNLLYVSPTLQGIYDVSSVWKMDLGLKWTFANDKAELKIQGNDLFNTFVPDGKIDYKGQKLNMNMQNINRNLSISFTYKFNGYKEKKHKEIVRILDLCTGSGCILLSMLHYVRRKRKIDIYGVGSDISKEALAVAVENAKKLGIEAKFVQGDLFENVEGSFDMILSNPPYIRTSEIERLQEEVRFHDPIKALDGKEDGLYFYRIIVKESRQYLKRGGWLIFEIGSDQAEAVKTLLQEAGYENIEVKKDLAGLDRVVYGMYS